MFFSQKSEKLVRVMIISLIFIMFPSISLFAGDKTKCPCKYKAQMIIGMAAAFDNSVCYTGPGDCDPRNPAPMTTCEADVLLSNDGSMSDDEEIWFSAKNDGNNTSNDCILEIFANREQVIRPISEEEVQACLDEIYNACDIIGWED